MNAHRERHSIEQIFHSHVGEKEENCTEDDSTLTICHDIPEDDVTENNDSIDHTLCYNATEDDTCIDDTLCYNTTEDDASVDDFDKTICYDVTEDTADLDVTTGIVAETNG